VRETFEKEILQYEREEERRESSDGMFPLGFRRRGPMWKAALVAGVGVVFLIGGCATYHPMPITSEAVRARLQPPDEAQLRILANKINHPILHPVELKPGEGLSPDGAAVLAVLLNPSLRAVRDQRLLANAQLLDAGLLPNPELSYSLGVPTGGDTAGRVNAYGLGLSWDVTSLISRASRIGEAKAGKEAVDLDIAWQEWQVAQAAKAAVYQLVSLQNRTALAEQASQQMAQNQIRIQKAVAEGLMTANALNAAQAASRQANENLLGLEKQADQQRLHLRRLLGLPADRRIRLSTDIHLPSLVELPSAATLLEGLEQRRLDLLALRRGYDSQEEAVRAAILEQFPRISIGPTISRDTDNVRTTGFGLNIQLPIFNRNQGRIARERATRQKLFDEYVNRVFEARSDIRLVLSGMRFTNEQIAAAQEAETDLARLVESYRAALAGGRTDALIYYGAWNDLVSARMKVVALKGQFAQALVALELATGFYEIPKPGRPPKPTSAEPKEEKGP
jgi:cobalt-zinc-cadmium efflux system outer membrane protein